MENSFPQGLVLKIHVFIRNAGCPSVLQERGPDLLM